MRGGRLYLLGKLGLTVFMLSFFTGVGLYSAVAVRNLELAKAGCVVDPDVVRLDVRRWPAIALHVREAQAAVPPEPRILFKNDVGEERRRRAAMAFSGIKRRRGMARDEYPPAMGRSNLSAHVKLVPAGQNSSQGASMGNRMRRYCNGQRFELVAR